MTRPLAALLALAVLAGCGESGDTSSAGSDGAARRTTTTDDPGSGTIQVAPSLTAPTSTTAPAATTPTTAATATTATPAGDCPAPSTRREKLSELLMVTVPDGDPSTATSIMLSNPFLGGVFVGGSNDATLTDDTFQEVAKAGRWFVAVDEEGGRVQRVDNIAGSIPSPSRQAADLTPDQIRDLARQRGLVMRDLGVNVDFAPVVDLSAPTRGLVIGDRSYGTSAAGVVADAGAFAAGLRDVGVLPTLKHFPGHGRAIGDSHKTAVTTPSLDELRTSDMVPYAQLALQPRTAVMVGHLDVPGLTEEGRPSSVSPATYALLRNEVGFGGVVFTDELLGMQAIASRYGAESAVVEAIVAGADVALVSRQDVATFVNALDRAVERGRLSEARVEEAVGHVLAAKRDLGLGGCT